MTALFDRFRWLWQQRGRPRPSARPVRFGVALLAVSLASVSLLAFAPPETTRPASPAPSAALAPGADGGEPVHSAADPPQLPAFPGAAIVGYDEWVAGSVSWLHVEYVAQGQLTDEVRQHYRSVLRDGPWRVQDVDFRDEVWTIVAVDGRREVRLDIAAEGRAVRVVATVSDEVPSFTPARGRAVGR